MVAAPSTRDLVCMIRQEFMQAERKVWGTPFIPEFLNWPCTSSPLYTTQHDRHHALPSTSLVPLF